MNQNGARTTICVTTLNRSAYVERMLKYYVQAEFGGALIIGDGSSGVEADATRDICERYRTRLRIQLLSLPDVLQPRILADIAGLVETDFAVYSGDDDYLVPSGLALCEQMLDDDSDLVAARGRAILFNMDGVYGVPYEAERYHLPTLRGPLAFHRLQDFFTNYAVSIFCVHRAAAWRRIWENCADMQDKAIGAEIAPGAFSAILGQLNSHDELFLVRQIHRQNYRLTQGRDWILSSAFQQSALVLTDRLADLLGEADTEPGPREWRIGMAWNAFMEVVSPNPLPKVQDTWRRASIESAEAHLGDILYGKTRSLNPAVPVISSLVGEVTAQDTRPRMLLSWGSAYILEDTVGPLLPELSKRYWILLLLVDYHLTPETRELAQRWKTDGLIADVHVAPSHGVSIEAHYFMAELLPMLKALDFDLFYSISAMQPYERYIIDCALPDKCLRILLWPHPTNLHLYPSLANALQTGDRVKIEREIKRLRRRVEPKMWRELLTPRIYSYRVFSTLLRGLARVLFSGQKKNSAPDVPIVDLVRNPSRPAVQPVIAKPIERSTRRARPLSTGPSWRMALNREFAKAYLQKTGRMPRWQEMKRRHPIIADWIVYLFAVAARCWNLLIPRTPEMAYSTLPNPSLVRTILNVPIVYYSWNKIKRRMPGIADSAFSFYYWAIARRDQRKISRNHSKMSRQLIKWSSRWSILRDTNFARLQDEYQITTDRYIYPRIFINRAIPFQKLDFITQIGTDQFDACMFFNDADTESHRVLFDNLNCYTVRYTKTMKSDPGTRRNAVLMPFTLHTKRDITSQLLDFYARDLKIALLESGAAEVHLRPHPGRKDDWLGELVAAINQRGVPCIMVPASDSITKVAPSYRGVLGAVSASLRDVRLSCPDVFVVGSMALSLTQGGDPKSLIGFGSSIGWIEADGSYDPRIFQPATALENMLPSIVDMLDLFRKGIWHQVPERLRKTS